MIELFFSEKFFSNKLLLRRTKELFGYFFSQSPYGETTLTSPLLDIIIKFSIKISLILSAC